MDIENFPSCCGARIIHDFFHGDLTATALDKTLTAIKEENVGIVVAITSESTKRQKKAGELLKARGFKKVVAQMNPNTDRKINLWALDLTRNPIRKKVVVDDDS